jgi:hypothetical protein
MQFSRSPTSLDLRFCGSAALGLVHSEGDIRPQNLPPPELRYTSITTAVQFTLFGKTGSGAWSNNYMEELNIGLQTAKTILA